MSVQWPAAYGRSFDPTGRTVKQLGYQKCGDSFDLTPSRDASAFKLDTGINTSFGAPSLRCDRHSVLRLRSVQLGCHGARHVLPYGEDYCLMEVGLWWKTTSAVFAAVLAIYGRWYDVFSGKTASYYR